MTLFDHLIGLVQGPGSSPRRDLPPPVVLFVDPEPNVIQGHRRMVRSLRPRWTPQFASGAPEAIKLLATTPVDVIVTELNLRCMDGTDLLASVQKLFPQVVRIVLSSETDNESETILRATQSAHQFLVKPFQVERLLERIEHAMELRALLRDPELARIISGIPHLPSLPPLYHELVRALSSPNASLTDVGTIIAKDVSMTGRVLQLVNSAFFGLPRRVTSPQEAAVLLGVNTLKSLVLYVKLFFAAPDSDLPGFSLDELWAHSSLTAKVASEITRAEGGDQRAMEEAMLAGMLHDVGKLLILDAPAYLGRVGPLVRGGLPLHAAEYQEFSTSHAEIGAYLLGLWGLPDIVVEAVACHHRPLQITQGGFSPITAVYFANAFLDAGEGKPSAIDPAYLQHLDLSGRQQVWEAIARPLQEQAKAKARERAVSRKEDSRS